MIPPRSQARIRRSLAIAQQQKTQTTTLVKPLQSAKEGKNVAKQMPAIITLDSDSESQDHIIELSDSSESIGDTLSADDSFVVLEDEDVEAESENEGESSQQAKERQSPSSPAGELIAQELVRQIRSKDEKTLTIDHCKSYLRNYGLRLTGAKPVLISRIKLHMLLNEGGCRDYDRTTFTIDCKGDVCKGDVVMFDQTVYDKYDVKSRSGVSVARRTVAGRVLKESYGAQRQQHTFTVEVLWSSGCKPLPLLKQLLVKGRNLYKRRTFRQRWADEGERRRILDEKHERGAAARHVRATKKGKMKRCAGTVRLEVQQMMQLASPYHISPSFEPRPFQQESPNRRSAVPDGFPRPPLPFQLRPGQQGSQNRQAGFSCPPASFDLRLGKQGSQNRQAGFSCPPASFDLRLGKQGSQNRQAGFSCPPASFELRPGQQGSQNRQAGFSCPPASFDLRRGQQGSQNRQSGFPCPTAACLNLGSKYCSNGICSQCCRRKGEQCSRHRIPMGMSRFK